MGADGGICWVYLNEPIDENAQKLRKLLPWQMLTWEKYYDDPGWGDGVGHDYFLDEIPDNALESTYGTSQDFCVEMLYEFSYEVPALIEEGLGDFTLGELADLTIFDISVMGEPKYNISQFQHLLIDSFKRVIQSDIENPWNPSAHIQHMTVKDWYEQVKACCKIGKDGTICTASVETWT